MNPGDLFDNRYRIEGPLGRGGFGQTYLARDTQMPSARRCVIKELSPLQTDPATVDLVRDRFGREAVVLEQLGDQIPAVPRLYAYFQQGDRFFLVQEWIEGDTLLQRVNRTGVLAPAAAIALLERLLPTIAAIHQRGIVHRDIKPDNLILRPPDDWPVPIDFGAVKETMGSRVTARGTPISSIAIGTPGFMAAEQAAGRPTFSSDLYSLALTVLYGLTGTFPEEIPTDPQTGELLWMAAAPPLPPPLEMTLTGALGMHPRDRFSSAEEMLAVLKGGTLTPTVASTAPVTPPPRPVPHPSALPTEAIGRQAPAYASTPHNPAYDARSVQRSTPPSPYGTPQDRSSGTFPWGMVATVVAIAGVAVGVTSVLSNSNSNSGPSPIDSPSPSPSPEPSPSPSPIASPSPSPRNLPEFYFLGDSAYGDAANADRRVAELRQQGYDQAGQFWIPGYANLSGQPFFQVYAAQFDRFNACREALLAYGRDVPAAYCSYASNDPSRDPERLSASSILPAPSPTPTPTPSPTPTPDPSPSPEPTDDLPNPADAVRDYFAIVDRGDYETGWTLLTPDFQRNHSRDSYDSYTDWWRSVERTDIEDLRVLSVNGDTALVRARIAYRLRNGRRTNATTSVYELRWDEDRLQWRFADVGS
ncbi:MAG: hypothetical protein Fur0042_20950 [Cyanophyceae cyanobacterium]